MLRVYRTMADLPFGKLMEVYAQTNRQQGQQWLHEPEEFRTVLAEREFYAYLRQCFFTLPSARYFLWEEQGRAVSAVRCEGYRDGVLLTGLETAPECRGQGYATMLLKEVLRQPEMDKVYVHIRHDNKVSLAVHLHCGFKKVRSGTKLLDGSYSREYDTYVFQP